MEMSQISTSHPGEDSPSLRARSAWRQRIVEAERGFTAGFRANSAFFFYFFTTCILLSFAVVLGLSGTQWALILLSVTVAISSELLYFAGQQLSRKLAKHLDEELSQLLSMVTAASMLTLFGSIATVVTVLGFRVFELYG